MHGFRIIAAVALLSVVAPGCRSSQTAPKTRIVASNEPALDVGGGADSGTLVAEQPPKRSGRFVDRHPLFYKPREYYDSSGNNVIVKGAAATLVGIPAGVVGEVKQMVQGRPESAPSTY